MVWEGNYSEFVDSDITPVVLAAGTSSRMGYPKALCDFDGKTCIELVLSACRGLGAPIVVLGAARVEIQEKVDLSRSLLAFNEERESGQTASLKIGLGRLPPSAKAFLLYPVDTPLVNSIDVDTLLSAFRREQDPNKAVFIPSYGLRRGHPDLFRRPLADEFLSLTDDTPARTVINRQTPRIRYVDFQESHVLMDMDTPEDYDRCLGLYRTRMGRR